MGVMFAAPPERMSRRGRQQVRVTRGILGLTKGVRGGQVPQKLTKLITVSDQTDMR